ncbi:MAG: hypothetical protein RH862_19175 [Leptospiraceae bacterium]
MQSQKDGTWGDGNYVMNSDAFVSNFGTALGEDFCNKVMVQARLFLTAPDFN